MMDKIAGFQRYLSITEEDRLETLHPPEKTPELFERYLPYAIALGVENKWASKFAAGARGGRGGPQPAGQYDGLVCRLAQRLVEPQHVRDHGRRVAGEQRRLGLDRARARAAAPAAAASPAAAAVAAAAAAGSGRLVSNMRKAG